MRNLLITLFVIPFLTFAQSPCDAEVCVVQFNAGWNSANNVEWLDKLKDCDVKYIDIATDAEAQSKYEIVVVPTIIVFNGKEVKRFQADISFAMKATKSDVQEVVDEIIMDQF
tara:strand:+ start:760 stop:1098 length:339 start_codon:yes stop_codon:yes gene_type:complete